MTDEQRFDTIGGKVITPNLERLKKDGILFKNAYTPNPSCIPARAAIFTGKFPSACKCPTYKSFLPQTEKGFTSYLRECGYYTAVIGKQHFAESKIDRGYDYEDIIDRHTVRSLDNIEKTDSYTNFIKKSGFTDSAELSVKRNDMLAFDWICDVKYHIDYFIGEQAKEWLKTKNTDGKPYYACFSFPGPHMPYDLLNTKYAEIYKEIPDSIEGGLSGKPPHFDKIKWKVTDKTELLNTKRAYLANITLIDEKIGEIIDVLKSIGEYDNTLIFFTSDHGDFMGDYGCIAKGQYLSESLMRIPFILKPPKEQFCSPIKETDDYISSIDIAATCLKAAGCEIPKNMSSVDLSSYFTQGEQGRNEIFMEAGLMKGIIVQNMKLVYYTDREYGELYDLKSDPGELNNLWNDKRFLETKDKLKSRLLSQIIKQTEYWDNIWNVDSPDI